MKYDVVSFERVGPIGFGLSRDAVVSILGRPEEERGRWGGGVEYQYSSVNVMIGHHDDLVEECVFMSGSNVTLIYDGIELDGEGRFILKLCQMDGSPFESVGCISLYNLGIMLIDFFDKGTESFISVLSKAATEEARINNFYDEPVDLDELQKRMRRLRGKPSL